MQKKLVAVEKEVQAQQTSKKVPKPM